MAKLEAQGDSAARHAWLQKATAALTKQFSKLDYTVPENVRVSVGFPRGGRAAIGQCWGPQASRDGHAEIFISPELGITDAAKATEETIFVLSVIAHELAHAIVGVEAKHKGPFKQCATAVGLTGKMTATVPGDDFKAWGAEYVAKAGTFPMGKLDKASRIGKQTTRLLKCECPGCGYVARVTRKWIEEAGAPVCPVEQEPMICDTV